MSPLTLDFYGLPVAVSGDWPEVEELLRLDFGWFERPGGEARFRVEVRRRPPSYEKHAGAAAAFVTPRNVVYRDGELAVVDYFGRALTVLDRAGRHALVEGEDEGLVHEAAYLLVLSLVGEHLDAIGLPRLHGLALGGEDGAAIVMLPSGGGKTTLALRALADGGVRLIAEDTPLIDAKGRAHPFPLRLGVNATDGAFVPAEAEVRRVERMEFHAKYVMPVSAVGDRLATEPEPVRHLVVGRRSLGTRPILEPVPRSAVAGTLLREGVVGVGVYQGMEFVLQRGMRDVAGKAGVATRRARSCLAALGRARTWRFTLGRDHDANWQALAPLLRGEA